MAIFRIPYYVVKPLALGGFGHYWQPSPALARKGWKPVNLGASPSDDDREKQDLARAKNGEVDAWRNDGQKPRAVKRFTHRRTMAELVDLYRADAKFTDLADNTQRVYRSALKLFLVWATDPRQAGGEGNLPLASITPERVAKLRDALMKPAAKGGAPRHHRAHNLLRVLRTVLAFAVAKRMIERNPADRFDLSTPAPRDQVWEPADVAAFAAAAIAMGYPGLAFAVELAEYTGQREADLLALNVGKWREVKNLDRIDQDRLAGPDGRVMGVHINQKKMSRDGGLSRGREARARWVGIPIAGDVRGRIEAAIAANARRTPATALILVDDKTGRPWTTRQFIRRFTEAKAIAIAPPKGLAYRGLVAHPALAELQFRDLRRTCVVRLGELGLEDALIAAITGHMLASIKRILETYMPRTNKMAARAVVARIGAAPAAAEKELSRDGR